MFDIIEITNEMLKSEPEFYNEILFRFSCRYCVCADSLPDTDSLVEYMQSFPKSDHVQITFDEYCDFPVVVDSDEGIEEYNRFVRDLSADEVITIDIVVKKNAENGVLNVYKLDDFIRFLASRTPVQSLENFATLFNDGAEKLVFRLLDKKGTIQTENIAFSDGEVKWDLSVSRTEQLKKCMANHPFLKTIEFPLMPQDFSIRKATCCNFLKIEKIFAELHDIVSDIYMAKHIFMAKDKIILQKNSSDEVVVFAKSLSDVVDT